MSFYYAPKVANIADPYSSYNSGGTKFIVNEPNLVQFKQDTDEAFRNVASTLHKIEAQLHQFKEEGRHIRDENIALRRMLDWVNSHYPEAIHALEATMKVVVKFDEATDDTEDVVMERLPV
jgi:hypothetical protein